MISRFIQGGVFFAALFLLLLYPSGSVSSQAPTSASVTHLADPIIRINIQQAASFQAVFAALSQSGLVTFVAEDQPLHMTLTPEAVQALKIDEQGEPLSALITKIAAAYDYDVLPSGKVYVLTKHYSDPQDLPDITLKECALAIEDVERLHRNLQSELSGRFG